VAAVLAEAVNLQARVVLVLVAQVVLLAAVMVSTEVPTEAVVVVAALVQAAHQLT
jgi:hypothetical protein